MELQEYLVTSASGEYRRTVWLLPGVSGGPQKLCVFLDAEYYLNRMDTVSILLDLQTREVIPSVTCVFVSNDSNEARHHDYTCNPPYSRFVALDLMHWVWGLNPELSRHDNCVCGLSLSGLASAYLALAYPEIFSAAVCQSGSFWWNSEWLSAYVQSLPSAKGRFWISVGDQEKETAVTHSPTLFQEVSQITGAENFARVLRMQSGSVHYNVYSGGHAIAPWNVELPDALHWLLGEPQEATQ